MDDEGDLSVDCAGGSAVPEGANANTLDVWLWCARHLEMALISVWVKVVVGRGCKVEVVNIWATEVNMEGRRAAQTLRLLSAAHLLHVQQNTVHVIYEVTGFGPCFEMRAASVDG